MNKFKIFGLILFVFCMFFFGFSNKSFSQQTKFYQLELFYDKGKLELKNMTVLPGTLSTSSQEGEYRFDLLSFAGSSLYKNNFQIPLSIHVEKFDPTTNSFTIEEVKKDSAEVVLNVPYFPNGKEIVVYDKNEAKVLEIPVIAFAEVTPSLSPTQEINPTLAKESRGDKTLLYIGLGGLGLGIAFAIYLFRQYRRKDIIS